ncbi:unnamed protein product, partial [Effrenium voratum]
QASKPSERLRQNLGWARALELLRFLRSCSLRGEAALGNLLAPPWRQSVDLLGVMGADLRQDAANFNAAGSACGKAAWEQAFKLLLGNISLRR